MASGGGEGGFGIRIVEDEDMVLPNWLTLLHISCNRASNSIARKSPSIEGFELPGNHTATSVGGMKDKAILDMGPKTSWHKVTKYLLGSLS